MTCHHHSVDRIGGSTGPAGDVPGRSLERWPLGWSLRPCGDAPGPVRTRPRRHLAYHRRMPRYDAGTALLVVDVQNDFADPAGSLHVGEGEAVLPVINAQVEAALAAGAHVVYTQD